jgi:hypothetical protein
MELTNGRRHPRRHPKLHRTGSGHGALNTADIIAARRTERTNGLSNRGELWWLGGFESSGTEVMFRCCFPLSFYMYMFV